MGVLRIVVLSNWLCQMAQDSGFAVILDCHCLLRIKPDTSFAMCETRDLGKLDSEKTDLQNYDFAKAGIHKTFRENTIRQMRVHFGRSQMILAKLVCWT